jgi:hypothetical protein
LNYFFFVLVREPLLDLLPDDRPDEEPLLLDLLPEDREMLGGDDERLLDTPLDLPDELLLDPRETLSPEPERDELERDRG